MDTYVTLVFLVDHDAANGDHAEHAGDAECDFGCKRH